MAPPEMPDPSTPASVTPSYRRNGKLFSCEPCRRGKLRCDHESPICGRCARRDKPEQCVYHPAPLTKPRGSPGIGPHRTHPSNSPGPGSAVLPYPSRTTEKSPIGLASPPGSSGTQTAFVDALPIAHPPAPTSVAPTPVSDERSPFFAPYVNPDGITSSRDSRTGFLGATSYSAVYTENRTVIETPELANAPRLPAVSSRKIQEGVDVLTVLRDLPTYRKFTQAWLGLCDGIVVMQPVFNVWLDELWAEWGAVLTDADPEQLQNLSELVWYNTRMPMAVHGDMTAREWAKSASGCGLRWEVVGVLLAAIGLVGVNLSGWDTVFETTAEVNVDRGAFAERMRKAAEHCLCFCYESEALNDIYLAFLYIDLILVECIKGEAHYAAWQRTGELCDAVVALGLHQGNRPNAETPFFLAEWRKKLFIGAYGHDKTIASFLGRPPRLSHRYCKMEVPLDLSDEQLCSEGPALEAHLSRLDAQGWNTDGNLHRTTWSRIWFQHCRIREDILELALGTGEEDITFQAEHIRTKMDKLHSSFPSFMMVTPEKVLNGSDPRTDRFKFPGLSRGDKSVHQIHAIFVICIHTGILHTEFLLQRALINRTRIDTKTLIPISRRMLKLVLLAHSRRDLFKDDIADLFYLLAFHGLPAAGVLAVEMLKQEQSRQYLPDILPRSETIQDLSIFISALASVGPGEGNFSICDQGRRALSRVLDQILAPSQPLPVTVGGEQAMFDDSSRYFPTGNDADFLQWLENVDWDKTTWMEAPQQPSGQSEILQ